MPKDRKEKERTNIPKERKKIADKPYLMSMTERKEFFASYKDIYVLMGYKDEDIAGLIEKQMNAEVFSERYYNNVSMWKKMIDEAFCDLPNNKYKMFDMGKGGSTATRIIRAMYKPETCVENVQYNEMLSKKVLTKQGAVEVLQEAAVLLTQVTPELYEEAKRNPVVFMENYNALMLGFVGENLAIEAKAHPDMFPNGILELLAKNRSLYTSLQYFDVQANLSGNSFHYAIPEDTTQEQFAIAIATLDEAKNKPDATGLNTVLSKRGSYKIEAKPYVAPDEECKAFFEKVQERMANERRDYEAAAKKAEEVAEKEKTDMLKTAKCLTLNFVSKFAKDRKIVAANRELVEKNTNTVKDHARESYGKPFREAADEMEKILEKGSIFGHSNANYEAMLASIKTIKAISHKGELKDLSKEDKKKLYEEFLKLDLASEDYLLKKSQKPKPYSAKALQRYDAARLASFFVCGRITQLVPELNKDLKAELPRKTFTMSMAQMEQYMAGKDYKERPTVDSFARRLAYAELNRELDKGKTMPYGDAKDFVEGKVKAFRMLYNQDAKFQDIVKRGKYEDTVAAAKEAIEKLSGKAKKEPEAKPAIQEQAVNNEGQGALSISFSSH